MFFRTVGFNTKSAAQSYKRSPLERQCGCWRRFLLGSAGLGDLRPVKPQTYDKVTPKLVF